MPTKEQILNKYCIITFDDTTDDAISKALDDYAESIFKFGEWASASDWTYLYSKDLWYNEEDEQNITPLNTQELFQLYEQNTNKS
jgi:hypothetical protein